MYAEIDQETKFFITQTQEDTGIPTPTKPLYQPKWTGTEWIEAMPVSERDALKIKSQALFAKSEIENRLQKLTVTVDNLEFNANEKSQIRMLSAIQAAKKTGQTETTWRLADNTEQNITLAQLESAQALAIQAIGALIIQKNNGAT